MAQSAPGLLAAAVQIYQGLNAVLPNREPLWTAVVLIGDDDYWKGRLAGRSPIRRDYLADLVLDLDGCDPRSIVLDFNFRSPATDGSLADNGEYAAETCALATAIERVAPHHPVVLPVTLAEDKSRLDPSVLDAVPDVPGEIERGAITLPYDYREIPTAELLAGCRSVRSLALAAASVASPSLRGRFSPAETHFPFGSMIPADRFQTFEYRESVGFGAPGMCDAMRHRIVLVGSGWHGEAWRRGAMVDSRQTPLGTMGAVYLHANYVEALLQSRVYRPLGEAASFLAEALFSIAIALVLGSRMEHPAKFATTGLLCVAIALLTYVFAQNFGVFGDFFSAVILLVLHAAYSYWEDLEHDGELVRKLTPAERDELERRREPAVSDPTLASEGTDGKV